MTVLSLAAAARGTDARRRVVVAIALAAVVLTLFVVSLMIGSVLLSPSAAWSGLVGSGQTSTVFVVRELRLPRATAALLIGLALGIAGTLFQRVLGNPLASPDFLGIAGGASTATVAGIVFGSAAGFALPVYAAAGAFGTAVLVALLAWTRGISVYRFILVGVGVSMFASSVTSYLIARAEFRDARAAMTWLVGSVGFTSGPALLVLAVVVALAVPAGSYAGRALRALELDEDSARILGVRVQRDRLVVLAVGVVLVAAATAAAGPIMFVAMLAGPLAGLLLGTSGRSILAAALMGAVLLQVADLLAQHALPWPVSTGVVTGVFGAPYIVWVLVASARNRSGS